MTPARRVATAVLALGAAVVAVAAILPPASRVLAPPTWRPAGHIVRGTFHAHTVRSDGAGTPDEVAAAASRAGLRFLILTDHGDATRPPDRPAYRSGVLCLDAVEISTDGGHYAALGLGAAPYPLGGDPRDVVEDVARLGGFGVVTHPDSPKSALAWRGWNEPFDALEWLNADSEWRDESGPRLALALVTYPFRRAETLAALFDRPATLRRWDELTRRRRVLALAGSDAHARAGWKSAGDPYEGGPSVSLPSYESSFGAFSLTVTLDRPLSGNATEDAGRLLAALRGGRVHTLVDGYARAGAFEFSGQHGEAAVFEGDEVPLDHEPVVLRVRTNATAGSQVVLLRDGREVSRVRSASLVYATNRPGVYRAEAWLPGAAGRPMPWAVSNPIFIGWTPAPAAAPPRAGETLIAIAAGGADWHVEHDPTSSGLVGQDSEATTFDYRLGAKSGRSQFAALAHDGRFPAHASGLVFRASADAPMRVSVQVRVPGTGEGERWSRSIYLDRERREIVIPFAEMRPQGPTSTPAPRVAEVQSLLFVVDRTNAAAGSGRRFAISHLRIVE